VIAGAGDLGERGHEDLADDRLTSNERLRLGSSSLRAGHLRRPSSERPTLSQLFVAVN
jgi:hypothetical protein